MRASRLLVLLVIALLLVLTRAAGVAPARAAGPWYVAPGGNDTNNCTSPVTACASINGALNKPGFVAGDTVKVAVGTYTGSGNEVVLVSKNVTLSGGWDAGFAAQSGRSTIDGQNTRRGVTINNGVSATIERFSARNGLTTTEGGGIANSGTLVLSDSVVTENFGWRAGGILNAYGGTMTINRSSISGNTAGYPGSSGGGGGGGIESDGTATLNDTTVSNNVIRGGFNGNGINAMGSLTLNNSTISGNTGGGSWATAVYVSGSNVTLNNTTLTNNEGFGLFDEGANVSLRNSILSNNSGIADCYIYGGYSVIISSLGYNLIQKNSGCVTIGSDLINFDPKLGPLQDNGGATFTHVPLLGSLAIDAGNPGGCMGSAGLLTTDQRGYPRNERCDIGAVEFQRLDASEKTVLMNPGVTPSEPAAYAITVKNGSSALMNNIRMTDTLPSALTYLVSSLKATSGTANQNGGTITWTGNLNAGAVATITFNAVVSPTLPGGTRIMNSAALDDGTLTVTKTAVAMVTYRAFFPFMNRIVRRISGHVTYQDFPAAGIPLELRFYDGATWSTRMTTVTGPDGSYVFNDVPALSAGQRYYVRYRNTTNPNYLSSWSTRAFTSTADGFEVNIGDFDIDNIELYLPLPGSKPSLPNYFQWMGRIGMPSDSYEFNLLDPTDGYPWWWTPHLGDVNAYTLTGLPSGFTVNAWYAWFMGVYSPDGGYGVSYYAYYVLFTTPGSPPASRAEPIPPPDHRDPIEDGTPAGPPVIEPVQ